MENTNAGGMFFTSSALIPSQSAFTTTIRTTTRSTGPVISSLRGAKPYDRDGDALDTWVLVVSGAVAVFLLCPLVAFLWWSLCRHHEYGLFSAAISHREGEMVSEPSDGDYMCPTRTAQPVLTRSLSGFLRHVKSGANGEYAGDEVDTSTVVIDASGWLAMEVLVEPPAVEVRNAECAQASSASFVEVSLASKAFVDSPQNQVRDAEIALAIEAAEVGNDLVVIPPRPLRPASVKDDVERAFFV